MHPNPAFRHDDRALFERLIHEIGFGMVFATTPDGPRVAHVPLVSTGDGSVQFHLARGNALARHLNGMVALAVVNGPDAYVSPRWYGEDPNQVPTWNYVALEMEGPVRRMDHDGLYGQLAALSAQEEAKLPPPAWTMAKADPAYIDKLMGAIVGFEMEVQAWRPTFKLSQNKSADLRGQVAAGLEEAGSHAMAAMMRGLV
ncbi:FMN-binding negative transcriptional regulator [Novosphingobium sp. KACC 22771]|uniref:FMN-binding negative transcriptional regulator n=1 Tax=Novosphingobium sp. KACC 22771 TaxID=3025670 RepID=UPI00236622AF|nr:FMN-binding negative transcriptional regulator [Novosphingobium sp. KACC 22771]WDF73784.1 FMN-binding negative transcriptional regulator [Novosphingobium sp. KACC 22771]